MNPTNVKSKIRYDIFLADCPLVGQQTTNNDCFEYVVAQ
jgi:hypothetical protein